MSFFETHLRKLKEKNLYRVLRESVDAGAEIFFKGKKYLNFSSNNYLGLTQHSALKIAAIEAIEKYGVGSGASRLITGSHVLHHQLEEKLATFKGTEKALVFNSGYHANLGVIQALCDKDSVVFSDEWNHASLIDACRLSGAKKIIYRHCDLNHLETLLKKSTRKRTARRAPTLIATDSVFSMDGDLAPLPELLSLCEKYDCWLYVDEAHGTGVFGKNGRGVVEHFKINPHHPRLIQMGTLGKAFGCFGAYVAGSKELIDYLINRARTFIFTTALPPSVMASAMAAIDVVRSEPELREKLWENVSLCVSALVRWCDSNSSLTHDRTNAPAHQLSPIIPLIIGDSKKTLEVSEKLFKAGIWAQPIRPPTVPEGTSRIRFTVTALHTKNQIEKVKRVLARLRA